MPRERSTDPDRIHRDVRKLAAGHVLRLKRGKYRRPVVISDLSGTEDDPIVIRGARPVKPNGRDHWPRSESVFCGKDTYGSYRNWANMLSKAYEETGKNPGVYFLADNAQLILRNCQWVVLRDLTFDNCWPTAVYVENCQHITIKRLHIVGGTIAIGATGFDTRHLLIKDCNWIQDPSCRGEDDLFSIREHGRLPAKKDVRDCQLWRKTNWERIHGYRQNTGRLVDIKEDARAFDGDFFRTWTIAGFVILRDNCVLDAFNGVHFFSQAPGEDQERFSRNVLIERNWFVRIRDNAIEPEDYAWNWTVRHNRFVDCYAPFSIEPQKSGFFYIYGNVGWNALRPGPGKDNGDVRITGRVFKFATQHKAVGPHYVLHNTWYLRGPVFKKKRLEHLIHMNNVVGYNEEGDDFSYETAAPYGTGWKLPFNPSAGWKDIKAAEKERFTKAWVDLRITMDGDMIGHPTYPDMLRQTGYPIGPYCTGQVPEFAGDGVDQPEDLKLKNPAPAQPLSIALPNETKHPVPVGGGAAHVAGAWQGDDLFKLPDPLFVTYWERM